MYYNIFDKMIIKTDIRGSDLATNTDTEDMQVLSVDIDGSISLKSFSYDYRNLEFILKDEYEYKIDSYRTSNIISIINDYFRKNIDLSLSLEGPHFILEFYEKDKADPLSYRFNLLEDKEISRLVRQFLMNYDLFVFDGRKNYDNIEKIVLNYQRTIKENKETDEEVSYKGIREELQLDKDSINIKRGLQDGTLVEFSYKLTDKFKDFLGFLENFEVFYYIEDFKDELIYDPDDKNFYKLLITYEKKGEIITEGTYDRRNLPYFFPIFIGNLTEILLNSSIPDILDPNIYGKLIRSESDYIYLSVEFSPDSKSYYYRTDDETIRVGDRVLVPVGNHGRETMAEVVNIEYFSYENLPLPLEETKIVIKKIDD